MGHVSLRLISITVSFLAILLQVTVAGAQDLNLHFVNFTSREGLSSSTVTAVLKDRYGFMWFATDDGLNKFDGVKFTVYRHSVTDSTSLSSNRVQALYEDIDGNLWVGTSVALSRYNRKSNAFQHQTVTQGSAARAICGGENGDLWIGCYNGLYCFNSRNGRIKQYTAEDKVAGPLGSNTVTSVLVDRRNRLWVGTNAGLHLYQPSTQGFRRFVHAPGDPSSIGDDVIKAISEDTHGELWIGTNGGGLARFVDSSGAFQSYKHIEGDRSSLLNDRVYCIAPEPNGKIWIGTENGLNIFDPQSERFQAVIRDPRNRYSLQGKSFRSFYIDSAGIYWVGTFQSGVNKYDRNLTSFELVQSNPLDPQGLPSSKVTSFADGRDGQIYVGTDDGGLSLYDPSSGLFKKIPLATEPVTVLAMERSADELWIGTYSQGIYVLNIMTGRIMHYTREDGVSGLSSNDIFAMKRDRHGNMWIGTNGQNVDVFVRAKGKFERFAQYTGKISGDQPAATAFVRAIEEDNAGNIWIGSLGRGIDVYNPILKTLKVYNRFSTGFPFEDMHAILATADGRVWLGTAGNGLYYFETASASFKVIETSQPLPNSMIFKILQDEDGIIWFSTNKGISSFDPATKALRNYSSENGLQQSSFAPGAGVRSSSGELYFGGLEGFNHFLPSALHYSRNIPKIIFTGLKVDNQEVLPGNSVINTDMSMADEIRLKYGQNFSVDFTALDFTNPTECQYAYFLQGFNTKWNDVGEQKTVAFTNLDPGNYTLLVRATNANEGWITVPKQIAIFIRPPLWRTAYAYMLYALIILCLLAVIRYRAIRKLKRRFAEEQEKLKVKHLVEQERQESERRQAFDQAKIRFLTNLSHEFRTPVSLIAGPVDQLLQKESDRGRLGQLNMVKRNARRLLNLVNQLLDFRKLEGNELLLNNVTADLVAFTRDISESFKDLADRRGIRFIFTSAVQEYHTEFDRDKIERILFNLLSNAFKFTGADGEVTVTFGRAAAGKAGVVIHVTDTGIGITPADQEMIFDRFFQGQSSREVMNQGSGIGLSIVREFVRLHGGTIDVSSIVGKGSDFAVNLPLTELKMRDGITASSGGQELPGYRPADYDGIQSDSGEMLRILLIEDNEDFRTYLKEQLRHGYRVIEAVDGKDGWQKALSSHPDLIISDIAMPQMDGIALSKKLKADKRTAHIPVLLLTAMTGDDNHLKGLETGASDYLTKPFSEHMLKIKIRNILQLSHQLKETYERRLKVESEPVQPQSENDQLLMKITRYIEEKIDDESLSVEQLSQHLFMSRATLYNKLLGLTGETPVEFIRSVRLKRAAALLEKTDMRIHEISYAVGFATPGYFARSFKLKYNISPSEYAAAKRNKPGRDSNTDAGS